MNAVAAMMPASPAVGRAGKVMRLNIGAELYEHDAGVQEQENDKAQRRAIVYVLYCRYYGAEIERGTGHYQQRQEQVTRLNDAVVKPAPSARGPPARQAQEQIHDSHRDQTHGAEQMDVVQVALRQQCGKRQYFRPRDGGDA